MLRRRLLGTLTYVNPLDPAIDLDAWDKEKRATYFGTNFEVPPIKPGETPVKWQVQQLTGRQVFEAEAASSQYGFGHPEHMKVLLQYGLAGWSGIVTEDNEGNIKEFKPEIIDTPLGRCLSDNNFYDLMGFFSQVQTATTMAIVIYTLSQSS